MHHGSGLRRILEKQERDTEFVTRLVADGPAAAANPADRAMLDYARKLTRTPGAMESADVDALRRHGFDDRAIHDLCAIVGYFAFVNRIADGLGVELEEFHAGDPLSRS